MSVPIYLAVTRTPERQENPYWSPNNDGIESKFIITDVTTNTFLYSEKELINFLSKNAETIPKTIRYYAIEEIKPSLKVTHTLSINGRLESEV